MLRRLLPITVLVLASTACSDDGPTTVDAGTTVESTADDMADDVATEGIVVTVGIERSRFAETELQITVGTTVRWVNNDGYAHTVTSRDGAPTAFDSGEFGEGETFEFTFDEPGSFAYFGQIHPTMRATVVVS